MTAPTPRAAIKAAALAALPGAIEAEARERGTFQATVHFERIDAYHAEAHPAAILSLLADLDAAEKALAAGIVSLEKMYDRDKQSASMRDLRTLNTMRAALSRLRGEKEGTT